MDRSAPSLVLTATEVALLFSLFGVWCVCHYIFSIKGW
jgi:hypothetical protein